MHKEIEAGAEIDKPHDPFQYRSRYRFSILVEVAEWISSPIYNA